ncbi:MAG: ATP-binding protein, partial [Rhodoferax sp.]
WRNRASQRLLAAVPQEQEPSLSLFAAPVTPDPEVAAAMREALMASGRWRGVVELRDDGGKRLIINRMVTSLRSESGELEGFVSVAENVTENRRARERHKRVLETAIDGFLIADAHGKLLEANAAFSRLSGYTVGELRAMHAQQLGAASRLSEIGARMEETTQLGHDQFEARLRHKLGHEVSVAVSLTFDPEVQQYFVFVRDTTDQVLSAAVQLDLERQLQQSQKMEALGQLTGGVAHDFNNILASVLGYSKLALDRLVPDKQSKLASYLREVILASERARDLIAKMLVFSRTKSSAAAQAISPAAVVQEVLAMVRPSIPSSIQLDVRLEDDLSILMDAGDLNQILLNLIINARDAIDGHGVIGIRLHRMQAHGQVCAISGQRLTGPYLALEVTDTGSGIAPAHRQRMFDPFFTTKDVGKGTGLGLSMVQGIVLRSGGHIVVESQLGQGSMFQLLFPIASPALSAPDEPLGEGELLRGMGQHIWVVDDEPAVTRYLGELLEGQGYRVTLFNSPDAALAAFASTGQEVDLLITDQTMPGMDGTTLAERLHMVRPDLPVILCTGHGGGIDQGDLARSGIRHFFTNPVAAHDLLQVMADEWGVD